MKLTIVGCAGSYPTAQSSATCYLIEHDDARVILDMGNGSLGSLHNYLDPMGPIDAIILTHCHLDHCADVGALYVVRHHYSRVRLPKVALLGPSDARARLAAIYGMTDPSALDAEFDISVHDRAREVGPFRISTTPAAHPVEAYSVRVEAGGRSVTFSGDSGPNENLVELAHATDVALFEATMVGTGNPVDLHMSGAEAGLMAKRAGARSLILTHLVPQNDPREVLDEARSQFDGPIQLAKPGLVVDL